MTSWNVHKKQPTAQVCMRGIYKNICGHGSHIITPADFLSIITHMRLVCCLQLVCMLSTNNVVQTLYLLTKTYSHPQGKIAPQNWQTVLALISVLKNSGQIV